MPEESPSRLRFSIEESVWLNKGQEVDDIISMSLEPDISIVENKHYVSVRGSLNLAGEYRPLPTTGEEKDEPSLQDETPLHNQSLRPIDEVRESDEGTMEIDHRFPVDITIPLSRINRLEDIYVMVDSFDYTISEKNCLRLEADIAISGMADEQPDGPVDERKDSDEIDPFGKALEMNRDGVEQESDHTQWEEPFHYEAVRASNEDRGYAEELDSQDERVRGPLVEMKSRELETEPDPYAAPISEIHSKLDQYSEANGYSAMDINRDEKGLGVVQEEQIEEEVPLKAEETEYSRKEENALYLTKMLTKEEENFSSLKMCIIQRGESLDMISERYGLPSTQLARVNRLESEEIQEGQILYIPITS